MSKDGRVWLSHTGLETLSRCQRCFWLQYKKGVRQPEGIVSRLANRFDIILKAYFDIYRSTGTIPPLVEGKIEGKLESPFQEKYWARVNDAYGFFGKLDECLINNDGEYVPVDFKTASSDPREKEILSAYKSQVDDYIYLMKENNKKVANYGYLIFVFPDHGIELHSVFPMIIHVVKVNGDPENTKKRIAEAMEILENPIPMPKPECSFCTYRTTVKQLEDEENTILLD